MLTLPEQILLLALDNQSGTDNLHSYLDRALIAAAIMELVLQQRIGVRKPGPYKGLPLQYQNDRFWHTDSTYYFVDEPATSNSVYLEWVYSRMIASEMYDRLHTFSTLTLMYLGRTNPMYPVVYAGPPNQRLLAAQNLLAEERLIVQDSGFFLFRRSGIAEGPRSTGERELREQLRGAMQLRLDVIDERFRCLLLLIKSLGLIEDIWGTDDFDSVEWRVAQILRLTMEPNSLLADAHRYIVLGVSEESLGPLNLRVPIPGKS